MTGQFRFDWWFEPWRYALHVQPASGAHSDLLRLRDGYGVWCKDHGVQEKLPAEFDPMWSVAIITNTAELMASARMFGGLMAARELDAKGLNALEFHERKWCLAVAATQPLRPSKVLGKSAESMEARGLVELARRLEKDFPGMWSRLQLLLPSETAKSAGNLLEEVMEASEELEASPTRAQRCWNLCRERFRTVANNRSTR